MCKSCPFRNAVADLSERKAEVEIIYEQVSEMGDIGPWEPGFCHDIKDEPKPCAGYKLAEKKIKYVIS